MWHCAVIGCPYGRFNAQKTLGRISFHIFPHPVRESNRFRRWLTLVKNPKLLRMDPMTVFKSSRICRRHFAPDCFNGECRNLLPIATPTLNLPEVRPVALVQPTDAVGDELEQLLRDERKQQLKRNSANNTMEIIDEKSDYGKRPRIGITLLSSDVEDVEINIGERFIDSIITFDVEEEYDEGSLASDSRISSVCEGEYGFTSFNGLIVNSSELDTLNQVEILNEPPETLLNDSSSPDEQSRVPIEKGYEQLVREFTSEASIDQQEEEVIQMNQENEINIIRRSVQVDIKNPGNRQWIT